MHASTGFESKLFDTLVVSDWNKLPEKLVQVGSMCKFRGWLDNICLSAFGEDTANCGSQGRSKRRRLNIFCSLELIRLRVGATHKIRTFSLGFDECFYAPVLRASSDPRSSRCKNHDDQAYRCIVLHSNRKWNWTWVI